MKKFCGFVLASFMCAVMLTAMTGCPNADTKKKEETKKTEETKKEETTKK